MKTSDGREHRGSAFTRVLRVKHTKFIYMFVSSEEENDMIEFLKTVPVELRLTVGPSWENHFYQCKG